MLAPPLAGKTILVMGGTSGLGLSACEAIRAAGGDVFAVGRSEQECEAARGRLGSEVPVRAWDAVVPETGEKAVRETVQLFGRIDGLYHVAGGSGRRYGDGPLHEVTDEGWQRTIEMNLTSAMVSNRAALREFLRRGEGGSIVNLASVLAMHPSSVYFSTHAYAAAKAGMIGMSKAMAAAYAKANIRVNVVAPGLVDTPMAARAMGDEDILRYIREKQPLDGGRAGLPADIDGIVVYLLSDAARFCTGQVIEIAGGWSVSEGGARG
jgi:NAD(P)-dependent dehydrogenase (short-subunit alcohol dehydrogenase family)